MCESGAYYKILPNLTLKYSSLDTIFIPSDKKELRSRFLTKLDSSDKNLAVGVKVTGGRDGLFLEKPDIIDKFCRREISDKNPELEELSPVQFGKMFQPYGRKRTDKDDEQVDIKEDQEDKSGEDDQQGKNIEELDDEERVTKYYITTHTEYQTRKLPNFIKIKDPAPGEVALWVKRSFPRAARMHKKQEDNNPHRFFLSELMLYTGWTDEQELGCDNEEKCTKLYLEKYTSIQYVKKYLMPFSQGVETARHYVQQAMNEESKTKSNVGDHLDPELEKEKLENEDGEELPHPDYVQINPDDLDMENNMTQIRKLIRTIELKSADDMLKDARNLDRFQKVVLHIAIKFVQDLKLARKGKIPFPMAPLLMVHGGAGSGKSTVIHVMSQYIHKILQKEGDDPDCPYILLAAFTGAAASNINGQTLHTLFSFNFGAGYQSLNDKARDKKRTLYKNVKVLIIDEISLVEPDMLYKIDLRLREITQKDAPFGNVAIFALGDIMQIKPVMGRYIMQNPSNKQFWLCYEIDSLWHKFECVILETNHRQGEDKQYADMLNRIRIGQEMPADIENLNKRVRDENHEDIRKEKDALFIFGTNRNVNKMNSSRLKENKNEELIIEAICLHKSINNFKPFVDKATGTVQKTPFQKELKVKIGAKVMLTYNVDTSDGLTNGARGELIGIIKDKAGNISKLIVKFENESVGEDKRRKNQDITDQFPGGTPIEKVNFSFSISKSKTSVINTANIIQFPIKLAFACTAHKIQGATVPKPRKMIIDVNDIWMAAICYVMLSRICSLSQLYILNKFDESKMYPHHEALKELERLEEISKNRNPTNWEIHDPDTIKISSLNCRSLTKHFDDIKSDHLLLKSDLIALQETWIYDDIATKDLQLGNYHLHLNSKGRGKGIAIYFKKDIFSLDIDINEDSCQITKLTSNNIDIIVLYRSQSGNLMNLAKNLDNMVVNEKPTLVIGDFNFCYTDNSYNPTKKYFQENSFHQIISEPTHIEGNIIDQAHARDENQIHSYTSELHSKYYSDHRALAILIKKFHQENIQRSQK